MQFSQYNWTILEQREKVRDVSSFQGWPYSMLYPISTLTFPNSADQVIYAPSKIFVSSFPKPKNMWLFWFVVCVLSIIIIQCYTGFILKVARDYQVNKPLAYLDLPHATPFAYHRGIRSFAKGWMLNLAMSKILSTSLVSSWQTVRKLARDHDT